MAEMERHEAPEDARYRQAVDFLNQARREAAPSLAGWGGEGAFLCDDAGGRHIDFLCGRGAVTLGHGDPDIEAATRLQADAPSSPEALEAQLAQQIQRMFPHPEIVRFFPTGDQAVAACVHLARVHGGRNRVMTCGRGGGVIAGLEADQTDSFPYNDIEALTALLEAHPGAYACVVMEPMSFVTPRPGFLQTVRELAHRHGALLVFDETATGFRFPGFSAQAHLHVTPDLTALGNGLGNGHAVAAIVGRADVIGRMDLPPAGESVDAVSLAAAIACVDKMQQADLPGALARSGWRLAQGLRRLIVQHELTGHVGMAGEPCWTLMRFRAGQDGNAPDLKTLWIQECARGGVLTLGEHVLSLAHDDAVIDAALAIYDEVLAVMRRAVEGRDEDFMMISAAASPTDGRA